jgi:nucleoside-diphosphate-sugar epimerase
MVDLAEMIRKELNASKKLIAVSALPPRMTLVKRPVLTRQKEFLAIEPRVSLMEGVRRVCSRMQERLGTIDEQAGVAGRPKKARRK